MSFAHPKRNFFSWACVCAYAAIIFYFSSIPQLDLPKTFIVPDYMLHTLEYVPFGFLVFRALAISFPFKQSQQWLIAVSMAFIVLYGISDELHQYFVPGRTMSLSDLLADVFGGACGIAVARLFEKNTVKN